MYLDNSKDGSTQIKHYWVVLLQTLLGCAVGRQVALSAGRGCITVHSASASPIARYVTASLTVRVERTSLIVTTTHVLVGDCHIYTCPST